MKTRGGGELANQFLAAFNIVDHQLSALVGGQYRQSFKQQVALASRRNMYVKRYAEDLLQYADLRNVIVHTRRANAVIAEPHEEVVAELEHISKLLSNPPVIADVMTLRPRTVCKESSVGEVLRLFRRYDISRCPIVSNDGVLGLVTAKCIVKWLEAAAEENSLEEAGAKVSVESSLLVTVEALLTYSSDNEYEIVGRGVSVGEVAEIFQRGIAGGSYTQAVLVTVSGERKSPLVGIVTPSDLPRLFEAEQ